MAWKISGMKLDVSIFLKTFKGSSVIEDVLYQAR
jgi:hypothetical protein